MTGTDDPTENEDDVAESASESADRTSSLEDLAESINRRREPSNAPDIDLDTNDARSEEKSLFDWFAEGIADAGDENSGTIDAISGASNVLLLDPDRGTDSDRSCIELLTGDPIEQTDVLFVTLIQSPDDRIETWQRHAEDSPKSLTVISLGKERRRTRGSTTITTESGPDDITIETLSDPADLTRLGITLSKRLETLATDESSTTMCVNSLTALLQYVEPQRLFRFLNILHGKLESHDTVAHYHLDPDAHEQHTLNMFESLFDAVVQVSDEGDLEVVSAPE